MSDTTTIALTESAPFTGGGFRLDKANGVARGVAVCGFVSANGRDYPREVLRRDHKVYESANVFLDHQDGGERKVREWFGCLKNVRIRESDGKPVADLHYPKTSHFTAEFEERAELFPNSFGLSHVAVCETKRRNGREVIEAIKRVESVDLVARPATNVSLFESVQPALAPAAVIPTDGKAFAEFVRGRTAFTAEQQAAFLRGLRA